MKPVPYPVSLSALAVALSLVPGLSPPSTAVNLVVPEVSVSVVNSRGRPVGGVDVELLAKNTKGSPYRTLASATTDSGGRVRFDPMNVEDLGFLGFRLSWLEEYRPRRALLYEIRAKKGKKTSGGRKARPGKANAFYVMDQETGGSCNNLFTFEASSTALDLTLRQPQSYAECAKGIFKHTDFQRVGSRNINAGAINFFSFDRDVAIGRDFVQGLGPPEHPPLQDPVVNRYVVDLVGRLSRASDLPDLEFHVEVIDADILNAFALPGGYIFVYRGLIEATETESELVGVLAHEIAHVTGRHGTEGLTSSITKVLGALALGGVLANEITDNEDTRNQILGAVLTGTSFWVMGGTRSREAEADRLGAQYAWRAGYDPRGLATFFDKLSASRDRKQTRLDQYFSDHPNDDVRVLNVSHMVDYFLPRRDGLVTSSAEYRRVKERLQRLPPPQARGEAAANALFSSFKAANENLLFKELLEYVAGEEADEEE